MSVVEIRFPFTRAPDHFSRPVTPPRFAQFPLRGKIVGRWHVRHHQVPRWPRTVRYDRASATRTTATVATVYLQFLLEAAPQALGVDVVVDAGPAHFDRIPAEHVLNRLMEAAPGRRRRRPKPPAPVIISAVTPCETPGTPTYITKSSAAPKKPFFSTICPGC